MSYIMKFHGNRKISGIKAVRSVFDIPLRESLMLLKATEGFVVTAVQYHAVIGCYTGEDSFNGTHPKTSADWTVERFNSPRDMTGHYAKPLQVDDGDDYAVIEDRDDDLQAVGEELGLGGGDAL